jgi:hypothetical protein
MKLRFPDKLGLLLARKPDKQSVFRSRVGIMKTCSIIFTNGKFQRSQVKGDL